ncbi:MAG: hypothetical protein ABI758_00255 [Candidatus Woesebacteria bacterium]
MKKLWFKRKTYGYGWTPASWQGWLVVAVFVLCTVWNFMRIDALSHSGSDTLLNFVPQTVVSAFVLVAICLFTGETPRWQWGEKTKKR